MTAGLTVQWLAAIPLAESELRFLEAHGLPALESAWEAAGARYFDVERLSVI